MRTKVDKVKRAENTALRPAAKDQAAGDITELRKVKRELREVF